jgi:hypothetical protein
VAYLVIQQVAGQAGQAGGLVGGAGQPPGGPAWRVVTVRLPRSDAAGTHGLRMTNRPIKIRNKGLAGTVIRVARPVI